MKQSTVLIVAKEQMIAALMGALVEHSGHRPAFLAADEGLEDAISRSGASLVLLDCEHDFSSDDEAFDLAAQAGVRVLLFSAQRTQLEAEELASRHGVDAVVLPLRPREFRVSLDEALNGEADRAVTRR